MYNQNLQNAATIPARIEYHHLMNIHIDITSASLFVIFLFLEIDQTAANYCNFPRISPLSLMQYALFFGYRLIQTHNAFEIQARIVSPGTFETGFKQGLVQKRSNATTRVIAIRSLSSFARKFRFISNRRKQILRLYASRLKEFAPLSLSLWILLQTSCVTVQPRPMLHNSQLSAAFTACKFYNRDEFKCTFESNGFQSDAPDCLEEL
mgnify:CR=1 FL=1